MFETVTDDTAVKPKFPLIWQVWGYNKSSTKLEQAVPYAEKMRGVHIVRVPSGSVVLVNPMISASISADASLYRDRFTTRRRNAARYFAADKVGASVCWATSSVSPEIRGCALGPLQLDFSEEQSTLGYRRKTYPAGAYGVYY